MLLSIPKILFLFVVSWSSYAAPPLPGKEILLARSSTIPMRLSDALDLFTKSVYDKISQIDREGNIIFSPFSIHNAVSMLYYGSPEDSNTHKQLASSLKLVNGEYQDYLFNYLSALNHYEDNASYVEIANKMYVDQSVGLAKQFQDVLKLFYGTEAEVHDIAGDPVAVTDIINQFVSEKTKGHINDLLNYGDISTLTRLLLVNAVYFAGDWKKQFNQTFTGRFHLNNGNFIDYPKMMKQSGSFWTSVKSQNELNADIIEIPYENEDYAMLLIVPNENENISDLNSKLIQEGSTSFQTLLQRMILRKVNLEVPKFKIEKETDMIEIFKALGVTDVFDPLTANLKDITENPDENGLYVSGIIHKATLEVHETGSEASAATTIIIDTRASTINNVPIEFKVDRPFLFAIMDKKNNLPLFFGRVMDPSNGEIATRNAPVLSAALIQEDPTQLINSELDAGRDGTTEIDCSTLGYENPEDEEGIAFPCKGQDTQVLKEAQEEQDKARQSRQIFL